MFLSEQTAHSSVVTYGFWQRAWLSHQCSDKPILQGVVKKKKKMGGRHGRAGQRLRWGPQTRQAAAGKLHQSVINEPTGRWDYMPNCTANQSIPKWPDSISLCPWPNTRDGIIPGLWQWLIIHNLSLHPSFEFVNTQTGATCSSWQRMTPNNKTAEAKEIFSSFI